jgi:phosphate transport system protein
MIRHFDQELKELRDGLMAMAGQVEEMLELTQQALQERNPDKAQRVLDLDQAVDQAELRLDQACIDLLALRNPIAGDLRMIASTLKIIPELERIADHSCNVAYRVKLLAGQAPVLHGDYLDRLAGTARTMVRQAIDAFVNRDSGLARRVIEADDAADELYALIYRELVRVMISDPLCIERASHLIMASKNLERIADQATNISEEVLFIVEGVNVKHPHLHEKS